MAIFEGKKTSYLADQEQKIITGAKWHTYAITVFAAFACAEIIYLLLANLTVQTKVLRAALVLIFFGIISLLVKRYARQKQKAHRFTVGSQGEDRVALELKRYLPDNYVVYPDLIVPDRTGKKKGNIDFAVIGPTGIFIIECKNHSGMIAYNGDALIRDGNALEKNFLVQAFSQAAALQEYLNLSVIQKVRVIPSIVFSNRNARLNLPAIALQNVSVMGLKDITRFILNYPPPTAINLFAARQAMRPLLIQKSAQH